MTNDPAVEDHLADCPTDNPHVLAFLRSAVSKCRPDKVHFCDGTESERDALYEKGIEEGIFIRLNQEKLPGCYLHRSDPSDVARVEKLTFICTPSEDDAGPTNNWWQDREAYAKLNEEFEGSFEGRTMYVIPFIMGPPGSPLAKVGVQITDSIYVVQSMGIMTRMGLLAWKQLGQSDEFTRCWHNTGELDPNDRYIAHFPYDNVIMSYGSGYGGNALLGKKCLALRIASFLGKQQGWMAEHMLILGVTDPNGEKTYVTGAFPSACGKTNFAMLQPPQKYVDEGWKVTTVGDDIAWMWADQVTCKMRAINPENGYFGVLPGTNYESNASAMESMSRDTIYTNVAMTEDGDVWWEGKTKEPPSGKIINWLGNEWTPDSDEKAAHPNSRFTAPMRNNPVLDEAADDPAGVPVSAIIFGGRRSNTIPLVFQSFNWIHGVYVGATLGSEGTAAAEGKIGSVRRDPMAMLPFIGYNVRDYLIHWFRMRKEMTDCPRIFHVNWFRRDPETGKFLWPGFGENMRVLKWIIARCHGGAGAIETPLGWMPRPMDIDLEGLRDVDGSDFDAKDFQALERVDGDAFKQEMLSQEELLLRLAGDLPKEMVFQRELLISRL
ncbi:MAG: phosphoenolpyruvate carboxykinase (GTP) [Planctomycetota bacterium]